MKKRSSFLSIGIPSMCMIFAVLCMVILSLLTLGTSKQDLQTSQLTLDQTAAYYTACSAASEEYKELADLAVNAFENSKDQKSYNTQMESVAQKYTDASWDPDTQILSFSVAFTDEQAIYIEVNASYPSAVPSSSDSADASAASDSDTSESSWPSAVSSDFSPEIITWKTISTVDWNPDTRQPVYKGDTK